MVLERIEKTNDIKKLNWDELDVLAVEIRRFLVDKVSKTGGHLASNLGAVELTMAMHLAFTLPRDRMVWDVGHQSYTHKLLTGRKEGFDHMREFGGMSGFPKRKESPCDAFDTGHSSTSLSAGLGMVAAREISHENYRVVSVIGDGSLTGGMAYEALNNVARLKSNYIIVLNDNNMSISENVGGMSKYLDGIRTGYAYNKLKRDVETTLNKVPVVGSRMVRSIRKTKNSIKQLLVPGMWFEDMGITYLGPVDGHNTKELYKTFLEAQKIDHAVLVHVITKKGKGYVPAENNPSQFHGIGAFDKVTGKVLKKSEKPSYTKVFSDAVVKLAQENEKLVAITAAMQDGTGLAKFRERYPERFFDVGIAEQHAVTFAAGLAVSGMKPVFAVYSSFLQRGYDQLVHDVCLQNLPVVFAVDRAGLVGNDGETHQGIFDLAYCNQIPNMTVMTPKNAWELEEMLRFAVAAKRPVAIRYPRGTAYDGMAEYRQDICYGKSEWILQGKDVAVLAVGNMVQTGKKVCEILADRGYEPALVNARFVKPMDTDLLDKLAEDFSLVVTIEDGILRGGFGESVTAYFSEKQASVRVLTCGIRDRFVEHGSIEQLQKETGLDAGQIAERICRRMQA